MRTMTEDQITIGQMFDFTRRHLPGGWSLEFRMRHDGVTLWMVDPRGETVATVWRPEPDNGKTIQVMVNYARAVEGMEPVWFQPSG
jgi:hypothetical protein